ncbi:hypothetical protein QTN47_17690 [Danxiaibacter flavus]|uniref:Uncharacterized protein n=1 Tax=Danxiaibacter flavus TaxID=3049108 RepID=A0ABV3ZHG8_9BACT|nr:hypothetical protein QNM32_17700 [Chitinophagaceae bacterium DXS]
MAVTFGKDSMSIELSKTNIYADFYEMQLSLINLMKNYVSNDYGQGDGSEIYHGLELLEAMLITPDQMKM